MRPRIDTGSFGDLPSRAPRAVACTLPPTEAPPPDRPAASSDLVAAVRRLTQICAEQLASAPRLGLQARTEHLLQVIDAAEAEAAGLPPPAWGADVEGYFLQGLYEELIQQPGNLFTGTRLVQGEEVPVPLSVDNWRECLRVFRAAVLRGDVVVPETRATARYTGERRPGHVFVPLPGVEATPVDPRSAPEQLGAIKRWTREILGLGAEDVVTVSELACRDPGCTALETVVAIFADGATRRCKFPRPGHAVTEAMLRQTLVG